MSIVATVGQAFALDGREAVTQAIHKALADFSRPSVSLAFIFASYEYDIQEVLAGAVAQLGKTPLIGFSTSGEITKEGSSRRSISVALIYGEGIQVRSEWLGGFSGNSHQTVQKLLEAIELNNQLNSNLLLVADGLNGDGEELVKSLPEGPYQLLGCLAGGDLRLGRTFQIGGAQAGTDGIAAALVSGEIKVGVGVGHGWQPVGAYFKVTMARGSLIRSLDGHPASEYYARLFGYQAREWGFPPLNTLVRLYPLGIEREDGAPLQVRTPLLMEPDGSLRMNTAISDGSIGHLLVGSQEKCLEAARRATREALANLDGAVPVLAIVLADASWQMLLEGQPGSDVKAVHKILGEDVPIAGGYTFGQLARSPETNEAEFLNQHIQVIVFGEQEEYNPAVI
ncbi:MAG: hypothetical protein FVQ83_02700 [Chloroflexi bacterium]|nr:hypothetical protein [Chloroflexota bacterium]